MRPHKLLVRTISCICAHPCSERLLVRCWSGSVLICDFFMTVYPWKMM
jgi:hypothetical protein